MKKIILWNIINSLLAGTLVFFGALTTGHVTTESFIAAVAACFVVAITKFSQFWQREESEFNKRGATGAFSFI